MNRTLTTVLVAVLALVGLADSWYLYQSATSDTPLVCDIGAGLDGCNIVAQSPYSNFLGQPLALYGVGFYALLFVLTLLVLVFPKRDTYRYLLWLSMFGVAMSAVFVFIQLVLIKAVCIYCLASAGIALIAFALARTLWRRHAPSPVKNVVIS